MKFGLESITRLCGAMDHPERAFRSVLIAGTNGKGSVTVMVETALRAAGYRAARYTSPHLVRVEERFVVDGAEIDTEALRDALGLVQHTVERLLQDRALEAPPTFFECTTAVAFELFRRAAVDIAVLEVGLGGRLDATNVVTPVVAAITSIDFDHQALLGDTIASIAREKAGIIKRDAPVVCGPLPPEAENVIRGACEERGARMVRAFDEVQIIERVDSGGLDVRTTTRVLTEMRLALSGRHQRDNAAVAVAVLEELARAGLTIPDAAIREGLTGAAWPGRLERFQLGDTEILLDAAHNRAGARALAAHLREIGWTGVTLIFGAMRDKDARGMLDALAPLCASIVCTTAPSPRAMPAADLALVASGIPSMAGRTDAVGDPGAALEHARRTGRRVVAAGSIFLIGPLRDILR